MAKRHLSQRQQKRIKKRQSLQIDSSHSNNDFQHGTVVTHYGQHLDVALNHDLHSVVRSIARANLGPLVVGDEVLLEPFQDNDHGKAYAIAAVCPRKTLLERPDPYGKIKPIAANVDQIIVVIAPNPKPSRLLLDRYLAAIELAKLPAIIALNKTDLWSNDQGWNWKQLETEYSALGYPILRCCANKLDSLTLLSENLKDKTSVLVGQSGVGKSSLVNTLIPMADQTVRGISEKSDLGQHTTTLSRLFALPQGGGIIDSPGIREFGLWHIATTDLIVGFREFNAAQLNCKFSNCSHSNEPGCHIMASIADGTLSSSRWQNYQSILASLAQNR